MKPDSYDDPKVEAQWLHEQRACVEEYLASQGVQHGGVAAAPDWHVAPYLAVWAIRSMADPEAVGWWAISGDVPTDYVSSVGLRSVRDVVKQFAANWCDLANKMERGQADPDTQVGVVGQEKELAPLLAVRARLLLEWSEDDETWGEDAG